METSSPAPSDPPKTSPAEKPRADFADILQGLLATLTGLVRTTWRMLSDPLANPESDPAVQPQQQVAHALFYSALCALVARYTVGQWRVLKGDIKVVASLGDLLATITSAGSLLLGALVVVVGVVVSARLTRWLFRIDPAKLPAATAAFAHGTGLQLLFYSLACGVLVLSEYHERDTLGHSNTVTLLVLVSVSPVLLLMPGGVAAARLRLGMTRLRFALLLVLSEVLVIASAGAVLWAYGLFDEYPSSPTAELRVDLEFPVLNERSLPRWDANDMERTLALDASYSFDETARGYFGELVGTFVLVNETHRTLSLTAEGHELRPGRIGSLYDAQESPPDYTGSPLRLEIANDNLLLLEPGSSHSVRFSSHLELGTYTLLKEAAGAQATVLVRLTLKDRNAGTPYSRVFPLTFQVPAPTPTMAPEPILPTIRVDRGPNGILRITHRKAPLLAVGDGFSLMFYQRPPSPAYGLVLRIQHCAARPLKTAGFLVELDGAPTAVKPVNCTTQESSEEFCRFMECCDLEVQSGDVAMLRAVSRSLATIVELRGPGGSARFQLGKPEREALDGVLQDYADRGGQFH